MSESVGDNPTGPGLAARSYLAGSQGVFVPLAAVRMTGDPAAAILFGQLLWWTTRAEHPHLVRRDGEDWLVRSYGGWEEECGLTAKQARTAIKRLVESGLVVVRRWKHDGAPTSHLRVAWEALENAVTGQMDLPQRANGNAPEGKSIDLPERADPPLSETEETTTSPSAVAADASRTELVALCEHLAARVEANGSKHPQVTERWVTACRLMVERDGRTPDQIRRAIDWCQADEFWRANVMSMPKLREKYDQMRLQAKRNGTARPSAAQARDSRNREAIARLAGIEQAS